MEASPLPWTLLLSIVQCPIDMLECDKDSPKQDGAPAKIDDGPQS